MYLQGSHYYDNDINIQFYEEEYSKPDSTFLQEVNQWFQKFQKIRFQNI